ncbi:MAG: methyl-accepting chemotaxis protein [Gammaproteobacteria bacterium]|nr:methyl-accepting chemotaxis protein [Gammaproteobacteria bacterium]
MDTILAPGVALIDRLRYPLKFFMIFVVMLIPMVFMGYLLISEIEGKNTALEAERVGIRYFSGLRPLLQHLPEHRGMAGAFLGGDAAFRQKMLDKQGAVDDMLDKLGSVDRELGEALETAGRVSKLRGEWETLKGGVFGMTPKQSFVAHVDLIAGVIDLGHHVANTSGLILDPFLDSYYMMDLVVMQMPILTEGMGQSRALGSVAAATGAISTDNWAQLAIRLDRIRMAQKAMNGHMEVIFTENPALRPALQNSGRDASAAVATFADLISSRLLEAKAITITTDEIFASSTKAINGVFAFYDAIMPQLDRLFMQRIEAGKKTELLSLLALLGVMLLIIYIFAAFYRAVVNSISAVARSSQQLADGDLTATVTLSARDEMSAIAVSFNNMSASFRNLVGQVLDSSGHVATAAEELSTITLETNNGIARQQLETDQVATAINEMSATVQEVAASTQSASVASHEAINEARGGERVVGHTIKQINVLAEGLNRSAQTIRALEADSESIGTVVDVIRGIAEQTNLLALNAAIEAARAGEQGRGFAVVADEVRNLASKTQASTQEIQVMIEKLQGAARRAAEEMNKSSEQTNQSVEAAAEAGASLQKITAAVNTINDMNTHIASAAEEQSAVAEEINRSIVNISQISEQNATGASQTSSASHELAELANSLQQTMSRFKV